MESLTEFKPLERVKLPDLGELDCTGLILIVGPNSSGKTQLLQDIYLRVAGQPRDLVVAENILMRRPENLKGFIGILERAGYVESFTPDDGGPEQIRPTTSYIGMGQPAPLIQTNQAETWFKSFAPTDVRKLRRKVEFLEYFGRLLVTALFLDRRLASVSQVPMFDHQSQPPQNDLHSLYINDTARSELLDELTATFSKSVWPDATRGNVLCLRVADGPPFPSAEERLSPVKTAEYRTIESEGDGLKSYVGTCIALLLGHRPVCVIDEPELCLHPPQAYDLGRFIGRFGTSSDHATFVATHSSHVLRGAIQTPGKLQIVRLTRSRGEFHAHWVPPEALEESLKKPTVRAESILDGVFAEAVVVVEADGDRSVYQAVWETLGSEFRQDVHFAAVGGTGGIFDTTKLYKTLKIPVAVIADLDIIANAEHVKVIVSQLGDKRTGAALATEAEQIITAIRALPPSITPEDVQRQINEAVAAGLDWTRGDDIRLHEKLIRVGRDLDRMRRLKGGASGMPDSVASLLARFIERAETIGLFVVSVGELEGWLVDRGVTASKQKWAWANDAAARVRQLGAQDGDVWDFMRKVGRYLGA